MREEAVYAYRFDGKRYDCGSKLGYLQATVEYALSHPQLGREFRRYLSALDIAAAANGTRTDTDTRERPGNGTGPRRAAHGAKPPPRAGGRRRAAAGPRSA
jgi:hypothetical protein